MADSVTELLETLEPAATTAVAAKPVRDRLLRADVSVELRESWKYTRLKKFLDPMAGASVCEPVINGLEQQGVHSLRLSEQQSSIDHLGDGVHQRHQCAGADPGGQQRYA